MFTHGVAIIACVLGLAIGSFLYGMALSKDIKMSLFYINRNARAEGDQSILLEQIVEFLQLHSSSKQLSKIRMNNKSTIFLFLKIYLVCLSTIHRSIGTFSDLFQHFITMQFVWNLVTISGALLMIQIQMVEYRTLFSKF